MNSHLSTHAVVLLATLLVSVTAKAAEYTARALPQLDESEDQSRALAINKRGEIVGVDEFKPVMWDRDGDIMELPPLDPDSRSGEARAINKHGEVAGWIEDSAVVWDSDHTPEALEPPDWATRCQAHGINRRRIAVGFCEEADSDLVAVRWNRRGTPQRLPLLSGYTECQARGINDGGRSVGTCRNTEGSTAVVWGGGRRHKVRALRPLVGREDASTEGYAINNRGSVVGYASGFPTVALIWKRHRGRPKVLPPLSFGDDQVDSEAYAINDRGEVAGASIQEGIDAHATAWGRKGHPFELPPSRGACCVDTSRAVGINKRGEVVGQDFEFGPWAVVWDRSK